MGKDVAIRDFLRGEGFDNEPALALARATLEAAGLTREGKLRIADDKLLRARQALSSSLARVCEHPDCLALASRRHADTRRVTSVSPAGCEICEGSNNRRAALALARRLEKHRIVRMLVVGGTPAQHMELSRLLQGEPVEVRYVDGISASYSKRDAAPQLEWAQLLVVWGATPLPHKVSRLYTSDPPPHLRVVAFAKRSVEALCREVIRSLH